MLGIELCLSMTKYRIQFVTLNLWCSFHLIKLALLFNFISFLRLQHVKINIEGFKNINFISSLTLLESFSLYLIMRLNTVCIIP